MKTSARDWRSVPLPERMQKLDRDRRGLPIPFLVVRDPGGGAHFTMNDEIKRQRCLKEDLCAICGQKLFRGKWYVGGPLSAFHPNGRYVDTPLHHDCMEYALQVCPYLAAPKYTGRLEDSTFDSEKYPGNVVIVDETMDPTRPPIFVGVMAIGHRLSRNGIHQYLQPNKPYRAVQYWRRGERISEREGEAIAMGLLLDARAKEDGSNDRDK